MDTSLSLKTKDKNDRRDSYTHVSVDYLGPVVPSESSIEPSRCLSPSRFEDLECLHHTSTDVAADKQTSTRPYALSGEVSETIAVGNDQHSQRKFPSTSALDLPNFRNSEGKVYNVTNSRSNSNIDFLESGTPPQQEQFGHISQASDDLYNRFNSNLHSPLSTSPNFAKDGSPDGPTNSEIPMLNMKQVKAMLPDVVGSPLLENKQGVPPLNTAICLPRSPGSTRNGPGRDPIRNNYPDDEYTGSDEDTAYGDSNNLNADRLALPKSFSQGVKAAILDGDLEKLKVLVMRGADLRKGDEDDRTPLHWAAAIGSFTLVEFLVSQEVNINASDRWETTPLEEAMNNGHHEIAQFFREHGGTMPHEIGNRLCHYAIVNDLVAMRRLIDAGANIDSRSSRSRHTALHIASAEGHIDVVSLLLENGAQVNIVDRWGKTPLSNAIENGHKEISIMLMENGAVSIKRDTDAMELCKAAAEGKLHKVKAMIEWRGLNPDVKDYDWRTPLHVAAGEGRLEIVQYLVSKGANVELKDKWGFNAYQSALQLGHPEIADFLNHNAMFTLKTELSVDDCDTNGFEKQLDEDSQMRCCKRFGRNRGMMHIAFKNLLEQLALKGGWEFAEFWTVSPEFSVLQFCQECCCINGHGDRDLTTRLTRFRNVSQGLLIEYNIFFGGSVLAKRRPAWFTHLHRLPQFSFFRSPMCKVAGLKTCLALPVSPDESLGEMLGAVILFGCEDKEPDEEQVLPLMDSITSAARIVTGKARLPKELISKWEYAGIVCDSFEAQVELGTTPRASIKIDFRAIALAIGLLQPIFEWTDSLSSDEHRACVGVLDSLAQCANTVKQYPQWPEISNKLTRALRFLVSVSPAARKETPVKGIAEEALRILEDSGVVPKVEPPYFLTEESPIMSALRKCRDGLIEEFEEFSKTHDVEAMRVSPPSDVRSDGVIERRKYRITSSDVFKVFGKRGAPKATGFGGGIGSMRRSPYGNVMSTRSRGSSRQPAESETDKCAKFINEHLEATNQESLMSVENLLSLHNCLDLDNKTHKGVFRSQWVVGSYQFYKFYRVFCPWEEIPRAIQCVLDDLNGLMKDCNPVLRAFYVYTAMVHYIHPFHDGNGRVSRLLCNTILSSNGYLGVLQYSDKIITFTEYLEKLASHSEAFKRMQRGTVDV
eukprot:CFRG6789T1